MAINNYELTNKPYTRGFGDAMVTIVEIRLQDGNRYSANMRELPGDRTGESENVLIQAVLDILKAELDPSSAIVKTQQELVEVKKAQELSKVTDKMIYVLVRNLVIGKTFPNGYSYKEIASLLPPFESTKKYKQGDLVTYEDPNYVELDGEGKRIVILVNTDFTYFNEGMHELEGQLASNGTLSICKFKPNDVLHL